MLNPFPFISTPNMRALRARSCPTIPSRGDSSSLVLHSTFPGGHSKRNFSGGSSLITNYGSKSHLLGAVSKENPQGMEGSRMFSWSDLIRRCRHFILKGLERHLGEAPASLRQASPVRPESSALC